MSSRCWETSHVVGGTQTRWSLEYRQGNTRAMPSMRGTIVPRKMGYYQGTSDNCLREQPGLLRKFPPCVCGALGSLFFSLLRMDMFGLVEIPKPLLWVIIFLTFYSLIPDRERERKEGRCSDQLSYPARATLVNT